MKHTEAVIDRLRSERTLAENGGHPILARSFEVTV